MVPSMAPLDWVLWPDIDILRPNISIMRADMNILCQYINTLMPDIDILWPDINQLKNFPVVQFASAKISKFAFNPNEMTMLLLGIKLRKCIKINQ